VCIIWCFVSMAVLLPPIYVLYALGWLPRWLDESGLSTALGLLIAAIAGIPLIWVYKWFFPKGQRTDGGTANPPPSSSEPSRTGSNLDELEKLASLRDKGTITEEEFNAKKEQLLGL
jgi:Short C-terminal domain